MTAETRTLETPDVDLVYDLHQPSATDAGHRTLLMAGHPMQAGGFEALAQRFPDRLVVTYDPRGTGRSIRKDGSDQRTPQMHATDLHALIAELGSGPVDLFASSGGAVNALALVEGHPDDVATLVAHEPPLLLLLPDADQAVAAERAVQAAYHERGYGAGMAAFIALTAWQGEFTEAYLAQPPPDAAQFGMPTDDDGRRDDPLLSGTANAITSFRPDPSALSVAATRVVVAVAAESGDTLTGRTTRALGQLLALPVTEFPSHHAGFLAEDSGYGGEPDAFATRLHEVLDAGAV